MGFSQLAAKAVLHFGGPFFPFPFQTTFWYLIDAWCDILMDYGTHGTL